jgi:hypothetical protein
MAAAQRDHHEMLGAPRDAGQKTNRLGAHRRLAVRWTQLPGTTPVRRRGLEPGYAGQDAAVAQSRQAAFHGKLHGFVNARADAMSELADTGAMRAEAGENRAGLSPAPESTSVATARYMTGKPGADRHRAPRRSPAAFTREP